ncbi:MAG: PDDEXK nuclease domain-containing protein [Elusimicrobia bacterium]|nr:PDDEXK nuclease domain-containing protein [Candidatus Liberimonas magnetica]
MVKKNTLVKSEDAALNKAYLNIKAIIEKARSNIVRAVDTTMVQAYWLVGKEIVEVEQLGAKKAEYGTYLLKNLSVKLFNDFGKGYDVSNLKHFRKFYLLFPKSDELRRQLCWTHYRFLLRVENPKAREFYINEIAENNWSTTQLERQINSFYYERLSVSRDKKAVITEARKKLKPLEEKPSNIIKDPYTLEFLGLKENIKYKESEIENAIIDKLQDFLLELGKGFCFVARQKRISTESKHFYIDLVFYNYLLDCFLLIDLKTTELTHQDIGQMDMYVRIYEDLYKPKRSNPSIGLILCTEKDHAMVKYSVLNKSKNLFASKYRLYLPTEKELKAEIERERKLIDQGASK